MVEPTFVNGNDDVNIRFVGSFRQLVHRFSPGSLWLTLPVFATECAERFNFYGFTALLTLYLQQHLEYKEQQAAASFGYFQTACYITPLLGSWLADEYFGKYRIILTFSSLYLCGQLILPVSSFMNAENVSTQLVTLFALLLIALGTGGIKPCVSAFGAEQVEWRYRLAQLDAFNRTMPMEESILYRNEHTLDNSSHIHENSQTPFLKENKNSELSELETSESASLETLDSQQQPEGKTATSIYFARFYLFINIGSILGQIICPWVKQIAGWRAAFFTSALVLFFSIMVFVIGLFFTGYVNIQRRRDSSPRRHPWHLLRWFWYRIRTRNGIATEMTETSTSSDSEWKAIFRVGLILSPIAIFWMCWSQQGSTWVQQLTQMEMPSIFGTPLNPAQWTAWNPLSVPLSSEWIYPHIQKCIRWDATDRIFWGMMITGISFACSALIQFQIEQLRPSSIRLSAWRTLPQWILLSVAEILVSISGLELAFSLAPIHLKSTIQALWLLTSSLGSLLAALSLQWIQWNYAFLFAYFSLLIIYHPPMTATSHVVIDNN
eukprot:jgi/Galph1/6007/GphlegSOOS_G4736.1